MSQCPCNSGKSFDLCCGPLLAGAAAPTPEALMRSRYTAYTKGDIDYLVTTLTADAAVGFDREQASDWSKQAEWQGLEIRRVANDPATPDEGQVEFVARFKISGKVQYHHELASFIKLDGQWKYQDGVIDPKPLPRSVAQVGRNDPCPCGSGKKFKKCCGA